MKDLPWNAKQSTERRQMSPRLSSAQWGARASHYVKCFICKFKFLLKGTHCNSIIRWQGSHHSLKRDFFGKLFRKRDTLRPSSFLRLKNGGEKIACILWFSQIWKNYRIHDGEFDHQKDSAIFRIHNTSQIKVRIFSLPRSPIFNLRWFECLKIPVTMFTEEWLNFFSLLHPPIFTSDDLNVWNFSNNATMVLNWPVWNLYPLYLASWDAIEPTWVTEYVIPS